MSLIDKILVRSQNQYIKYWLIQIHLLE